jgi:NEDD8-activating enzyme E1 regulatory subunit
MAETLSMPLSLLPVYLALSGTTHNPLATTAEIEADIARRVPSAADDTRVTQAAEEVARAAGGDLHDLAAIVGGMVAQEAIKVITKQYIPVDNTCIFDGISSRCQVLCL